MRTRDEINVSIADALKSPKEAYGVLYVLVEILLDVRDQLVDQNRTLGIVNKNLLDVEIAIQAADRAASARG